MPAELPRRARLAIASEVDQRQDVNVKFGGGSHQPIARRPVILPDAGLVA